MSKSKRATKAKEPDWKEAAVALGQCAMFTLQCMAPVGGGRRSTTINLKTRKVSRWQDQFFDALDKAGYEVDRKRFYASLDAPRRRTR